MESPATYQYKVYSACPMCASPSTLFKTLGKRLNHSQGLRPRKKSGITTTVVKCRNCGLVFSNPQPTPMNLQDHYGMPPESYWDKERISGIPSLGESFKNTIHALYPEITGLKALDIGAGLGKFVKALSDFGFDSYGIEPSETFYKKSIELYNFDTNKIQLASIQTAEFYACYFDFICFRAVLEHLDNPSIALKQSIEWLKPGGYIYVSVPSSKWLLAKFMNLIYKIKRDDYVTNLSPMHPPYHLYEFSIESFAKNAALNGYEIHSYSYSVCKTYMPKYLDWILRPIMRWTNTGMELYIWLRKK